MNAYNIFAKVYDEFMKDIPYEKWVDLISDYLEQKGLYGCRVFELGCGTATASVLFSEKGYKVTASDISDEMLRLAADKIKKAKKDIKIMQQDMRAIDIDESYPIVISLCDSINYMADDFELSFALEGVRKILSDGGLFIFDMKSKEYFESLGDNVYTDENELGRYIWENEYDPDTQDNYYYLTFYIKKRFGNYKKYTEEHMQHAFSYERADELIKDSGFNIKDKLTIPESPERVFYVLEKTDSEEK